MKAVNHFQKKGSCVFIIFFIIFFINTTAQKIDEVAKLLPSDGQAGAFFGNSVATDGEIAVIGAWFDNDMAGAAYVFRRNGDNWTQEAKLLPNSGSSYDFFGSSVEVYGDDVIVGATGTDNKGAAYLFHYNGSNWTQTHKFSAGNGMTYDNFGSAVSLNGDYAVIGASGAQALKGAVYVYKKNGNSWQEDDMLTGTLYSSSFGSAVDISGDAIIVGAGASSYAFVFMLDGSTWVKVAELTDLNGTLSDKFGGTVSIDGDLAVVGATYHQNENGATGAAYVYHRQGSNWVEEEKIVAEDGELDDHFGVVSIYGTTIVIGAYGDDDYGLDAGSAYIYQKEGDNWQFKDKLQASDGFAGDELGSSVAIFSNVIVAGAPNDNDNGTSAGSAYVFPAETQTIANHSEKNPSIKLGQNFPNPFAGETTISFNIEKPTFVQLTIFDCTGQKTETLVNDYLPAGHHKTVWNGTNRNGEKVKPGLYYFQFRTNNSSIVKRMVKL